MLLVGDRDHRLRKVQPDHVGVPVGEEPGDVTGTAPHVGQPAAARLLGEQRQQRAIQRLVVRLVEELGGVRPGDGVVGGADRGLDGPPAAVTPGSPPG